MTGAYGTDQAWHCDCGARLPSLCRCQRLAEEKKIREALYARLAAQGVHLDAEGRGWELQRLAALLVVMEDPYWSESDSVMGRDADCMIQILKGETA